MESVRVHAVVFTAVNAMLIAIWVVTGGVGTPFWPVWPMITWGSALMIHGGVVGGLTRPARRQLPRGEYRQLSDGYPPALDDGPERLGPGSERRWVVVMFVDIVGSTGLNEELGDEEWHRLLVEHRALIRSNVQQCNGSEVGTAGDGCMARFDSPTDAALCAVDIQREIAEENRKGGFAPEVRVGIHAGDAIHVDSDLLGNVVNLASRVADQAGAGEILVTEPVADAISGELAVHDRGLHTLKGLSRPRHLLTVEWAEAGDSRR